MRSLLFVPADSDRKLAKAGGAGADALILDLEDSVAPDRKAIARDLAADYLRQSRGQSELWVRVNDRASGELLRDLAAVMPARPAGIVLPKITGAADIEAVAHYLEALESAHGLEGGCVSLLVLVTETPAALLRMHELLELQCARLRALAWGAEDLSAALGAGDPRRSDGSWHSTYVHARTQCLLAAHALALAAIDTIYIDFRDQDGLARACAASRYDGFTGRLAIHPDQVAVINAAYTAGEAERRLAQRIIDAFDAGAGAGTVSIDGKMYDLPHLKAARRMLGGTQPKESGA